MQPEPDHQPADQQRDSGYFRSWWKHNRFWSCCGMDGLSVVFELPLETISPLPESRKQWLMGLLERLASGVAGDLVGRVAALNDKGPEQRLQALLQLGAQQRT